MTTLHLTADQAGWLREIIEHAAEGSCDDPCPINGGCLVHRARRLQALIAEQESTKEAQSDDQ